MCAFTRHPRALARTIVLELRPVTRFVLEVLLTYADKDGTAWVQTAEIARVLPRSGNVKRYSEVSVLRAVRELKKAGLLDWDRVLPLQRFPGRGGAPGRFTGSGGRVWHLDLGRILGKTPVDLPATAIGMESGGSIIGDRSGSIIGDRSSDPLCLSSRRDKMDPARPGAAASAAPTEDASETPGAGEGRGTPSGHRERPRAPKKKKTEASETPRARPPAGADRAPPLAPMRPRPDEQQPKGGGRGHERARREPPAPEDRAAYMAAVQAEWAKAKALGVL